MFREQFFSFIPRLAAFLLAIGFVAGSAGVVEAATHQTGTVLIAQDNNNGVGSTGHSKHDGHHGNPVPETPYALLFPVMIAGATWVVYRKRRHRSA